MIHEAKELGEAKELSETETKVKEIKLIEMHVVLTDDVKDYETIITFDTVEQAKQAIIKGIKAVKINTETDECQGRIILNQ